MNDQGSTRQSTGDGAPSGAPSLFARRGERGVALLIVIAFVALTSILVTNLAYSTFLQGEALGMVERRLKAEYMLKSLVNFAAGLIALDSYNNVDCYQEPWGVFTDGMEIPPAQAQLIGVNDPDVRLALEIKPVTATFPLRFVAQQGPAASTDKFRLMAVRLFRNLGMDDVYAEPDRSGLFPRRVFTAEEMVANLIDYLDADENSFDDPSGKLPRGIEGELRDKSVFRNENEISTIEELSVIPGFTPNRVRVLAPFVNVDGKGWINPNVAPPQVLQALSDSMTPQAASDVHAYARSDQGPFMDPSKIQDINGVPPGLYSDVGSLLQLRGNRYTVIARVSYPGQAPFFMRATVTKDQMLQDPRISEPVIY